MRVSPPDSLRFVSETSAPLQPPRKKHAMLVSGGKVHLDFGAMSGTTRREVSRAFATIGIPLVDPSETTILQLPIALQRDGTHVNLAQLFGRVTEERDPARMQTERRLYQDGVRSYPRELDFPAIAERARRFAEFLDNEREALFEVLLRYESFEVAEDELARSMDALSSLSENAAYYRRQIGPVAAMLPRNQPLYALTCFGVIPSYMASAAHVRAPQAMNRFFFDLAERLRLDVHCPRLHVSHEERETFIHRVAATRQDPRSGRMYPCTDSVIFTGTMQNADQLRGRFDRRVLFIANGAGHNPIVVTENADIPAAVRSAMHVQLYNQGQDCANPNALLVHRDRKEEFLEVLLREISAVRVGPYADRGNRVGPISEADELQRIQRFLLDHRQWIHPAAPGIIEVANAIVRPTVIVKPLAEGGNFAEQFAPVFFVQEYGEDEDLARYFEDKAYQQNAMYVTVFGESAYVDGLARKRRKDGGTLHDESTIIRNTDLHAPGIERGTQPYGGYGRGASCFSINGKVTPCPTLPQRELYEQLVVPSLEHERMQARCAPLHDGLPFLTYHHDAEAHRATL